MRSKLHIAAIAAALVASAGMASAADYGASKSSAMPPAGKTQMNKTSTTGSATSGMSSDLVLTSQQKKMIWQNLSSKSGQKPPSSFQASVGADVPQSVTLHAIPKKLASKVPTLAGMQYAKVNDKLLVVRKSDRKIEDVIDQSNS